VLLDIMTNMKQVTSVDETYLETFYLNHKYFIEYLNDFIGTYSFHRQKKISTTFTNQSGNI